MNMQIRSGLGIGLKTAACVCVLALGITGCAQNAAPQEEEVEGSSSELGAVDIAFTEIVDPAGIGTAGQTTTRVVLSTAAQYKAFFGHAAPSSVKFSKGDRVAFYSAGVKKTGGYDASITRIVKKDTHLRVYTHLEIPGASCPVTQSLTKPNVLVKFNLAKKLTLIRFTHENEVRNCDPIPSCDGIACKGDNHCELVEVECIQAPCYPVPSCVPDAPSCDNIACKAGQHCELQEVVCVRAPCYPQPTCVDDSATGPFCGGIAAFPCPGLGECTDNPGDGCNPANGGADCGGICQCPKNVACKAGSTFDPSPEVCDCVPNITPCATVKCTALTHCDDSSGMAQCVPNGPFCGGIAGIACPGMGACLDNPTDSCDPNMGGADCGGICSCTQKLPCVFGMVFNPSPDVCGCEVPKPPAGEACGKTTCGEGMECCNASCGICTPPGFACIQIACL